MALDDLIIIVLKHSIQIIKSLCFDFEFNFVFFEMLIIFRFV